MLSYICDLGEIWRSANSRGYNKSVMTLCMQGNYLRRRNYKGAEGSTSRSCVWAGQLRDNERLNKEMLSTSRPTSRTCVMHLQCLGLGVYYEHSSLRALRLDSLLAAVVIRISSCAWVILFVIAMPWLNLADVLTIKHHAMRAHLTEGRNFNEKKLVSNVPRGRKINSFFGK